MCGRHSLRPNGRCLVANLRLRFGVCGRPIAMLEHDMIRDMAAPLCGRPLRWGTAAPCALGTLTIADDGMVDSSCIVAQAGFALTAAWMWAAVNCASIAGIKSGSAVPSALSSGCSPAISHGTALGVLLGDLSVGLLRSALVCLAGSASGGPPCFLVLVRRRGGLPGLAACCRLIIFAASSSSEDVVLFMLRVVMEGGPLSPRVTTAPSADTLTRASSAAPTSLSAELWRLS